MKIFFFLLSLLLIIQPVSGCTQDVMQPRYNINISEIHLTSKKDIILLDLTDSQEEYIETKAFYWNEKKLGNYDLQPYVYPVNNTIFIHDIRTTCGGPFIYHPFNEALSFYADSTLLNINAKINYEDEIIFLLDLNVDSSNFVIKRFSFSVIDNETNLIEESFELTTNSLYISLYRTQIIIGFFVSLSIFVSLAYFLIKRRFT